VFVKAIKAIKPDKVIEAIEFFLSICKAMIKMTYIYQDIEKYYP
jgi:hypothetical protein